MRYTITVGSWTSGPMDIAELTGKLTDRMTGIPGAGELVMEGMLRSARDLAGTGRTMKRWEFANETNPARSFTVQLVGPGIDVKFWPTTHSEFLPWWHYDIPVL
jgi:hypothetical protein